MGKILGLDVGYSSLGWAVVDLESQSVDGMGVRIFTPGVDNVNGSNEASRNANRRMKRLIRRQYERRRKRKNNLRKFLMEKGFLPTDPAQYEALLALDPYEVRRRGLDAKLDLFEIGRAVDHINARRGFRSNRKAAGQDDEGVIYEGSKLDNKPGINAISDALAPEMRKLSSYLEAKDGLLSGTPSSLTGFRTAGEYLASLNTEQVRRRRRFLLREHFEVELDLLLAIQAKFHPVITKDVIDALHELVFWQRPLKSVRNLVGNCRFEAGKKRAHLSHPEFQQFRLLQQVNNLRVFGPGRVFDDDVQLKPVERDNLISYLSKKGTLKIETKTKTKSPIYKVLGLSTQGNYSFNMEALNGCSTMIKLTDVFGDVRMKQFSRDDIHEIWNVLNHAEGKEWLKEYAIKKWGLTEEEAEKASKVRLEDGYGSLSMRAIRKLLPYLEQGQRYDEACALVGYKIEEELKDRVLVDKVPALSRSDVRNPIVQTSFAEMRKVVNALIKEHGPFESIRVELGRELRKPISERLKLTKMNRENKDRNDDIVEILKKDFGIGKPGRADMDKYKLWVEQNHKCIYTGKSISQDELFNGAIDVDHILPYSRTLDDSFSNKVVCTREANNAKGNRTPVEACNAGIFDRNQIKERVEQLVRASKISRHKAFRYSISTDEMNKTYESELLERQLNDTRYIGRLTSTYLKAICRDVVVTNGALTSILRRRWGLDAVIPDLAALGRAWLDPDAVGRGAKSRADHRHHAIDALVVALTSRSVIQKISSLNARGEDVMDKHYADGRILLPDEPIAGLKALATQRVDNMIVSHRIRWNRNGQLHEETIYGITRGPNGQPLKKADGTTTYVVRKPIESLTGNEILNIVDPVVQEQVLAHLQAQRVDVSGDKISVPKNAFLTPVYMKTKNGKRGPVIKRVRVYKPSSQMLLIREPGAYVEPGSNDHMQLYPFSENGKKRPWKVLKLIEKVGRHPSENAAEPEMTLRINELYTPEPLENLHELDSWNVYRVQQINAAEGRVGFRHHAAALLVQTQSRLLLSSGTIKGAKLRVSVSGNVL